MVGLKHVFAAALLGAVSAGRSGLVPHSGYSLADYERDFSRKYTAAEREERREHFNKNLQLVLANNADAHTTWTAGVNELTDRSASELSRLRGMPLDFAHARESHVGSPHSEAMPPTSHLPRDVDWRKRGNVVTPVKNQGDCGSCWAFSATTVLESHLALNTQVLNELAVQQIVGCMPPVGTGNCTVPGGCNGGWPHDAFTYVKKGGMTDMWKYPYTSGLDGNSSICTFNKTSMPSFMTVDGYKVVPHNDASALVAAVATVGPISITVDARAWHLYHAGVFSVWNQSTPEIDHAVVLDGYGYDAKTNSSYWLVRNSWSPVFGESGYIRILRNTNKEEPCGMQAAGAAACSGSAPAKVCGVDGVLSFSVYPTGAKLGSPSFTPHGELFGAKTSEQYV